MFESIEMEKVPPRRRLMTLLVSVTLHAVAITLLVIIPLVFFNVLPERQFVTFLMTEPAPPPPPPPPPPPAPARQVAREPVIHVSNFVEPASIPKGVPPPTDEPVITQLPSDSSNDGIPGGMSGGVMGGVIGGVPASLLGGPPHALPSPPPPPKAAQVPRHHGPIVVAGTIEQAKLIERVPPVYPPLAAKARVQGVVILQITVGEKGNVQEVRVLRGSPLLDDAAVAAVRQWKYAPTILDGQPVPVIATVTVNFQLRTASGEASE